MLRKPAGSRRVFRITAIIPVILSLFAFALTFLAVVAGQEPGLLMDEYIYSLNTTNLGQGLIEFSAATTSTSTASAAATGIVERSASSTAVSSVTATSSAAAATSSESTLDVVKGYLSAAEAFLSEITPENAPELASTLTQAEDSAVKNGLRELNVSQAYTLYLRTVCEGSFSSPTDAHATFVPVNCIKYSDATAVLIELARKVPTSVNLNGLNITVPLLSEVTAIAYAIQDQANVLTETAFPLYIASMAATGLSALFSLVGSCAASFKFLLVINIVVSGLASTLQTIASLNVSFTLSKVSSSVSILGPKIGLEAKTGSTFSAMIWGPALLLSLTMQYWILVWFVEFRNRSYKARARTLEEKGNWRGIMRELLDDIKLPKESKEVGGIGGV